MVCLALLFLLAQASNVPAQATPLKEFKQQVDKYMGIHGQAVNKVGPFDATKSPKEIHVRELALGETIRAMRTGAKQGDVFTPLVAKTLRTIIYNEFNHRGPQALKNREDSQDEVPDFTPMANMIYPTTFPLATFPPSLLRQMPPLPRPLEYRLVQRYLILRDSEANLIVNVLPDAAPAGK